MPDPTLTLVDLSGIQDYVFGSNRLAENVGASALVEQATHQWPLTLAQTIAVQQGAQHNVGADRNGEPRIDPGTTLTSGAAVEVVYTGGGNALLLFADRPLAFDFAARYTTQLLTHAPGLEAALVHVPLRWNSPNHNFCQALRAAWAALAQRKATRPHPTPLLGLAVTAACAATGLVASGYDPLDLKRPEGALYRAVSAEVLAKLGDELYGWADRRLHRLIPAFAQRGLEFWYKLDTTDPTLASHGQGAYVAVVHADGNDMGQRFLSLTRNAVDDDHAVRLLRALSNLVQASGQDALAACGDRLAAGWDEDTQMLEETIALPEPQVMPFRPLVYGGDDVTFVCEGRLGLELAALFVDAFEQATAQRLAGADELRQALPPALHAMHACAGTAVVKAHYPFARAYRLSEDLVRSAKAYVRERAAQPGELGFSALDWHLASSPFYGGVKQIRAAEYRARDGDLAMRPVRLHDRGDEWRTWPRFRQVVWSFLRDDPWRDRRNKIEELRGPLRAGPKTVEQFRLAYRLPPLPLLAATASELQKSGWYDLRCGYFDAVEALDFLALIDDLTPTDAAAPEAELARDRPR